jgi:hypothetical protein
MVVDSHLQVPALPYKRGVYIPLLRPEKVDDAEARKRVGLNGEAHQLPGGVSVTSERPGISHSGVQLRWIMSTCVLGVFDMNLAA